VDLALHHRPTDRPCPGNDDTAVAATMRTDAGRVGVGRHDHLLKRMLMSLGRRGIVGLTGAGQGQASHDARPIVFAQRRLSETLRGRLDHRGKAALKPEPEICRPADGFRKHGSATGREPGPTARAATIYS
jgi:hypothetical protein